MDYLLYRIIRGRLPFKVGDLNLYIKSPDSSLIFDSYEIYEEYYDIHYMDDVLTLQEMNELVREYKLWDDKDELKVKSIDSYLDDLKLSAYHNHFDKLKLKNIKLEIDMCEKKQIELLLKKNQLVHLTCESLATQAQWTWIIENSTYYKDGDTRYDWDVVSVRYAMNIWDENSISAKQFREIARSSTWRQMWAIGKKTSNIFSCPSSDMTKEQLTLCSFSIMYDNVYESSDCPSEDIINDDHCLDGWFIDQKNKSDDAKKKTKADSIASKMKNADEIFIVAQSPEHIAHINEMNTEKGKKIKQSRKELIDKKGVIYGDREFNKIRESYNG